MKDSKTAPNGGSADSPFACQAISDTELLRILRRIEENIEARRFLRPEEVRAPDEPYVLPPPPLLTDTSSVAAAATALRMARQVHAPFFGPASSTFRQTLSPWRQPLYWLLNLPIRVFGRRQASHNEQVLRALENLVAALNRQREDQAAQNDFLKSVHTLLRTAFDPETSDLPRSLEAARRELRQLRAACDEVTRRLPRAGVERSEAPDAER